MQVHLDSYQLLKRSFDSKVLIISICFYYNGTNVFFPPNAAIPFLFLFVGIMFRLKSLFLPIYKLPRESSFIGQLNKVHQNLEIKYCLTRAFLISKTTD